MDRGSQSWISAKICAQLEKLEIWRKGRQFSEECFLTMIFSTTKVYKDSD